MTFPDFRLGDIASFWYPYEDKDKSKPPVPGPDKRPCLVLHGAEKRVAVSYGTRMERMGNASCDDLKIGPDERKQFGLDYPTRFCSGRLCDFPISTRWIVHSKGCIIGTIPRERLTPFSKSIMDRLKRGQKIKHIPSSLARMSWPVQETASPTVELLPNCAVVRSGDFSMEFWFDEEPSEVLEAIRTSPLLTQEEKATALDGLAKGRPAA